MRVQSLRATDLAEELQQEQQHLALVGVPSIVPERCGISDLAIADDGDVCDQQDSHSHHEIHSSCELLCLGDSPVVASEAHAITLQNPSVCKMTSSL